MIQNDEFERFKKELSTASDDTIWSLYAYLVRQLRERNLVRTRNITGERGEFLAIKAYNETLGLPNLQAAPELTKNVDALSRDGDRYAIKTISQKTVNTGIFGGLAERKDDILDKKFEYVVIVILDMDLEADRILELTWEQFLKLKHWAQGMKGWGLTVNKRLLAEAKVIYQSERSQSGKTWRKHLYTE